MSDGALEPVRNPRRAVVRSAETRTRAARAAFHAGLVNLDRRTFAKVVGAALAGAAARGLAPAPAFQPVRLALPGAPRAGLRFAYLADTHILARAVNERFVKALLRAVDDVNAMDPQPDFVVFGGDLAQLGAPAELELGAQILRELKAPLRMVVGEHDWYRDLGEHWRGLFGPDVYSFDQGGVHFVVLNSILQEDFWTSRGLDADARMQTVANVGDRTQNRFRVGAEQRAWLAADLAQLAPATPVVVLTHAPLYQLYEPWNFWTADAAEVHALLARFDRVAVVHGHTHQVHAHRIGNIHVHGMLATAWPLPYAPEGVPELTVALNRPNPFNPLDGCGVGHVDVHTDRDPRGIVDATHRPWNRDPLVVRRTYLASDGREDRPAAPNLPSY